MAKFDDFLQLLQGGEGRGGQNQKWKFQMQIAMKDMFVDGFPTKDSTPSNDHRVRVDSLAVVGTGKCIPIWVLQTAFSFKELTEKVYLADVDVVGIPLLGEKPTLIPNCSIFILEGEVTLSVASSRSVRKSVQICTDYAFWLTID